MTNTETMWKLYYRGTTEATFTGPTEAAKYMIEAGRTGALFSPDGKEYALNTRNELYRVMSEHELNEAWGV